MPPSNGSPSAITDRTVAVDPSSLRRFLTSIPSLVSLLESTDGCTQELLLQNAMRRSLAELGEALGLAAGIESRAVRANELRALAEVATRLARTGRH